MLPFPVQLAFISPFPPSWLCFLLSSFQFPFFYTRASVCLVHILSLPSLVFTSVSFFSCGFCFPCPSPLSSPCLPLSSLQYLSSPFSSFLSLSSLNCLPFSQFLLMGLYTSLTFPSFLPRSSLVFTSVPFFSRGFYLSFPSLFFLPLSSLVFPSPPFFRRASVCLVPTRPPSRALPGIFFPSQVYHSRGADDDKREVK